MKRLASLVGLLAALSLTVGCRSMLVWYSHSPDRRHRVEVVAAGEQQHLLRDGLAGESFRSIAFEAISFSADSAHLAYVAQSEQGWHVVRDQQSGPAHEGIAGLLWSADGRQLAYIAQDAGSWRVVRDQQSGPVFSAIRDDSLRFSSDGAHLAYVADRGAGLSVVRDKLPGPSYDGIASLNFMPNGQLAYVARRGPLSHMVRGQARGEAYDGIGEVVVEGGRLAYAAYRSPHWYAIDAGRRSAAYQRVDALVMSAQGKLAYVARRQGRELVVNGGDESAPYAKVLHSSLAFSPDGKLAYAAWPLPQDGSSRPQIHMFLDGKPGPAFDRIEPPVFAAAGGQWGYIGANADGVYVVIVGERPGSPQQNHQRSQAYAWASDLIFTPDGQRHGYLARDRRGQHMVVLGHTRSPFELVVGGSLTFDRSGYHWACLVGKREAKRFFFAIDGKLAGEFDMRELAAAAARAPLRTRLAKQLDASMVRQWVAAELEIALKPAAGPSSPPPRTP